MSWAAPPPPPGPPVLNNDGQNQGSWNVPNQGNLNSSNQGSWGVEGQGGNWAAPNQGTWNGNGANQGSWNDPNQGSWNTSTQGNWTDPNQGNWADPNQTSWNNQGAWGDASQGNWTDPNQGSWTDPNQGNWTDPNQGNWTDQNQGNWTDPSQGSWNTADSSYHQPGPWTGKGEQGFTEKPWTGDGSHAGGKADGKIGGQEGGFNADQGYYGFPSQRGHSSHRGQRGQAPQRGRGLPSERGRGHKSERGLPPQRGRGQASQRGHPAERGHASERGSARGRGFHAERGHPTERGHPIGRGHPRGRGHTSERGHPSERGLSSGRGHPAERGHPSERGHRSERGHPSGRGHLADTVHHAERGSLSQRGRGTSPKRGHPAERGLQSPRGQLPLRGQTAGRRPRGQRGSMAGRGAGFHGDLQDPPASFKEEEESGVHFYDSGDVFVHRDWADAGGDGREYFVETDEDLGPGMGRGSEYGRAGRPFRARGGRGQVSPRRPSRGQRGGLARPIPEEYDDHHTDYDADYNHRGDNYSADHGADYEYHEDAHAGGDFVEFMEDDLLEEDLQEEKEIFEDVGEIYFDENGQVAVKKSKEGKKSGRGKKNAPPSRGGRGKGERGGRGRGKVERGRGRGGRGGRATDGIPRKIGQAGRDAVNMFFKLCKEGEKLYTGEKHLSDDEDGKDGKRRGSKRRHPEEEVDRHGNRRRRVDDDVNRDIDALKSRLKAKHADDNRKDRARSRSPRSRSARSPSGRGKSTSDRPRSERGSRRSSKDRGRSDRDSRKSSKDRGRSEKGTERRNPEDKNRTEKSSSEKSRSDKGSEKKPEDKARSDKSSDKKAEDKSKSDKSSDKKAEDKSKSDKSSDKKAEDKSKSESGAERKTGSASTDKKSTTKDSSTKSDKKPVDKNSSDKKDDRGHSRSTDKKSSDKSRSERSRDDRRDDRGQSKESSSSRRTRDGERSRPSLRDVSAANEDDEDYDYTKQPDYQKRNQMMKLELEHRRHETEAKEKGEQPKWATIKFPHRFKTTKDLIRLLAQKLQIKHHNIERPDLTPLMIIDHKLAENFIPLEVVTEVEEVDESLTIGTLRLNDSLLVRGTATFTMEKMYSVAQLAAAALKYLKTMRITAGSEIETQHIEFFFQVKPTEEELRKEKTQMNIAKVNKAKELWYLKKNKYDEDGLPKSTKPKKETDDPAPVVVVDVENEMEVIVVDAPEVEATPAPPPPPLQAFHKHFVQFLEQSFKNSGLKHQFYEQTVKSSFRDDPFSLVKFFLEKRLVASGIALGRQDAKLVVCSKVIHMLENKTAEEIVSEFIENEEPLSIDSLVNTVEDSKMLKCGLVKSNVEAKVSEEHLEFLIDGFIYKLNKLSPSDISHIAEIEKDVKDEAAAGKKKMDVKSLEEEIKKDSKASEEFRNVTVNALSTELQKMCQGYRRITSPATSVLHYFHRHCDLHLLRIVHLFTQDSEDSDTLHCDLYLHDWRVARGSHSTAALAQVQAYRKAVEYLRGTDGHHVIDNCHKASTEDYTVPNKLFVVFKGFTHAKDRKFLESLDREILIRAPVNKEHLADLVIVENSPVESCKLTQGNVRPRYLKAKEILTTSCEKAGLCLHEDYSRAVRRCTVENVVCCSLSLGEGGPELTAGFGTLAFSARHHAMARLLFSLYETQPVIQYNEQAECPRTLVTRSEIEKLAAVMSLEEVEEINSQGVVADKLVKEKIEQLRDSGGNPDLTSPRMLAAYERHLREFSSSSGLMPYLTHTDLEEGKEVLMYLGEARGMLVQRPPPGDTREGNLWHNVDYMMTVHHTPSEMLRILRECPTSQHGRWRVVPKQELPRLKDITLKLNKLEQIPVENDELEKKLLEMEMPDRRTSRPSKR